MERARRAATVWKLGRGRAMCLCWPPAWRTRRSMRSLRLKASSFTPGDGLHVAGEDVRKSLEGVELSGFTMTGACTEGGKWDFAVAGEHQGSYAEVWSGPKPERDPVLDLDPAGLTGSWNKLIFFDPKGGDSLPKLSTCRSTTSATAFGSLYVTGGGTLYDVFLHK